MKSTYMAIFVIFYKTNSVDTYERVEDEFKK